MTDQDEISPELRAGRFTHWETMGVERIRADLQSDGHGLVGGPPQVRALAWEWLRGKDEEQAAAPKEVVTLRPTLYGVGIDLKETGRNARRWIAKTFKHT